eukprot:scaffold171044_cov30-Tisochrysis_lutea.AAC.2
MAAIVRTLPARRAAGAAAGSTNESLAAMEPSPRARHAHRTPLPSTPTPCHSDSTAGSHVRLAAPCVGSMRESIPATSMKRAGSCGQSSGSAATSISVAASSVKWRRHWLAARASSARSDRTPARLA